MKVFTCQDFEGHYPVGVGAVVSSHTEEEAAELLNERLRSIGLKGDAKPSNMILFPHPGEVVRILADGNY